MLFIRENRLKNGGGIMEVRINDVVLECVQGNIVAQEGFDAIVNAANAWLRSGGGVAGAIHRAAGPGLEEECRPLAPIKTGEAVITGGHNLPNPYVIHVLGPVYGVEKDPAEKLAACYRNALKLADEKGLKSIAFPAISTGAFGYPVEEAARVAFETVLEVIPQLKSVKHIRFVLYGDRDFQIHDQVLSSVLEGFPGDYRVEG